MSINSKWYLMVMICAFITVQAWSQVSNSPFTKYGIGESYSDALANTQGMAGIGVSQPQFWYVNNQNPALLIYNTFATFQVGILGESTTLKANTASEKHRGGNMNYLATSFIIKPGKWGTSLGLMPYTSLNYKTQSTLPLENKPNENYTIQEEGTGGLTQLYWSNGVRLNKDFSIGVKATYLFGAIDRISKVKGSDTNGVIVVSAPEKKTVAKDFTFSLGGSYSRDSLWGKDYRLSIGAVYDFTTNVNAKFIDKKSNLSTSSDTLNSDITDSKNGHLKLPGSITTGVSISRTNWVLGTEFNYQDWSNFSSMDENSNKNLSKSWRVALGGEYTPDPLAIEGFLKRITYRVGVSTEKCHFLVNGKPVKDNGVNFGFSLPTGRSSIDLGFKIGKRGNKSENLLEEKYFKIFFGITFNDQWFIRRRFD